MTTTPIRTLTALVALAFMAASCGGGGEDDAETTTAPVGTSADETNETEETDPAESSTDSTAPDATSATSGTDDVAGAGDFTPGEIEYRVVNLLDEPVDVYVRTSGLVEAFLVDPAVAPGAVTDFHAPPVDGVFVVTEADAGDATCVVGCDHFIAQLNAFPDDGTVHTVLLHDADGTRSTFDLWEDVGADRSDSSNAMVPADPATGLVVVTGIALTDADFGLRLGIDGVAGCQEPTNLENVLVGGTQTPAFAYPDDSADLWLFDNQDRECTGEPVGGPFTVDGGPGTRTHLILDGSPGAMDAIVLPMVDEGADRGSTESAGGSGDEQRLLAIELMTPEVAAGLGLPDDQAACAAEFLVDAIGPDVLLYEGELVDLDTTLTDYEDVAIDALVAAVPVCGIDPSLLD
jgi:hypothetical protein